MKLLHKIKSFLTDNRTILFLYLAVTLVSCLQLIANENTLLKNNNFHIFRASSHHLLQGLPLYQAYPKEYFDYFYYNPVFPVLFLPFALLPFYVSLVCWLSATMFACYTAFRRLPLSPGKIAPLMLLVLFDLHNNLDHTQTNPFLLAFMLLTWICMERKQLFWAAMFIILCFLIKGYGGIICFLCLYYKNWYRMIFYGLFWMLAFHALLLMFQPPAVIVQYYKDWLETISGSGIMESYSVYGVLQNLKLSIPESAILVTAVTLLVSFLVMQFLKKKERDNSHTVAFLMIWVIVFNRASESATYLIAMAGCALWYLNRPRTLLSSALFWATLLVATLIPTDISKTFDHFRYHYYLKCIMSLAILADILLFTAGSLKKQTTIAPVAV